MRFREIPLGGCVRSCVRKIDMFMKFRANHSSSSIPSDPAGRIGSSRGSVPGGSENGPNRSSVSRRPKVLRFDKGRVRKSFTFRSLPELRNFVSRTGPGSATFSALPFVDICTTSAVKLHVMVSGMRIASIYLPRCSCAQNCNFPLFLHAAKASRDAAGGVQRLS